MTATNHALTGAVIALAVKKPELAIPLAFLSHFALDIIPHYNPKGVQKAEFKSFAKSWAKKLDNKSFLPIFIFDMLLLLLILIGLPFAHPVGVSSWTIFFSSLAAISPDFVGGRFLIYRILKLNIEKSPKVSLFTRFHIWLQWMERPWGLWVELGWFLLMIRLVHNLIK